jgi:cob(I)alamin adenosyltransferase
MVVLNRIYTRSGDDGTTALGTGERRKKYDLRIEATARSTRSMP